MPKMCKTVIGAKGGHIDENKTLIIFWFNKRYVFIL